MTICVSEPTAVLLSGLALPRICKVGLPQAAQYVACPTTLPKLHTAHMCVARRITRCLRACVFLVFSLYTRKS